MGWLLLEVGSETKLNMGDVFKEGAWDKPLLGRRKQSWAQGDVGLPCRSNASLGQPHRKLWKQNDPSKLFCLGLTWSSLYTVTLIHH